MYIYIYIYTYIYIHIYIYIALLYRTHALRITPWVSSFLLSPQTRPPYHRTGVLFPSLPQTRPLVPSLKGALCD